MTKKNETKVMCPVCGSEFAIGEHEHTVKNATVIGQDSGLGEVYLPISKRGEALKAHGIDPAKYFSIQLPTGGTQMMRMDEQGKAVPVTDDDPVIQAIRNGGTIPNRRLFRRWVMSQVFHGLAANGGFTQWLNRHGYNYQWEMLIEELRVQAKLYGKDNENFLARNRWFNKELAVTMAKDYIEQLRKDAQQRPRHKCKGVPYITIDHVHYFVSDIEKKLIAPNARRIDAIQEAENPEQLRSAVCHFWHFVPRSTPQYKQCVVWKDAYKGMGAYATMQNLLRFHGCTFPKDNAFYNTHLSDLLKLEDAAIFYSYGAGWKLFGLMKQMLDENGIDIKAKMKQWSQEKKAKKTA